MSSDEFLIAAQNAGLGLECIMGIVDTLSKQYEMPGMVPRNVWLNEINKHAMETKRAANA